MKQGGIILVLVLALFVAGFWIKQKLNEIEVDFQSVRFLTISKSAVFGDFTIKLKQPFGEIDLSNLKLHFYLDGKYISAINQFEPNAQKVGNDIFITANFSIDPSKVLTLQNLIGTLVNLGNNTYTIKGEVQVKKIGITAKLPLEISGQFKPGA